MSVWFSFVQCYRLQLVAGELASPRGPWFEVSYGMDLVHQQSNPRGQPGRAGAAHAELPCRAPASLPTPGRGHSTPSWTGCVFLAPGPSRGWAQSANPVHASWPKRHGKRGQQARGDAGGVGRENSSRSPWPQVTASELRPHGLCTFSAGGRREVIKAIKAMSRTVNIWLRCHPG